MIDGTIVLYTSVEVDLSNELHNSCQWQVNRWDFNATAYRLLKAIRRIGPVDNAVARFHTREINEW